MTESRIRSDLGYVPETGVLTWLRGRRAGKVAGWDNGDGYIKIQVGRLKTGAHRVAWFLTYGVWPSGQIDHINGNPSDNRITNLRDVPARGNQQNVTCRRDNTSGRLGVTFHKATGKWRAQINHRGQKKHLGCFDDVDDAAASYELAKFTLHEYQPTERRV